MKSKLPLYIVLGLCAVGTLVACAPKKPGCTEKKVCVERGARIPCFHCVKPGRYGFAVQPHIIERTTCNTLTRDDLKAGGYRCNQASTQRPCLRSEKITQCDVT